MLQSFPVYTVHSAMHFQDLAYWAPEPVAKAPNAGPQQIGSKSNL